MTWWQYLIIPTITTIIGTLVGIWINRKFPTTTYQQKLLNLLQKKNQTKFNEADIKKLKDISLEKIENFINKNIDFKEIKNIILKLMKYLKYGDKDYNKIKNIPYNFSNDKFSIMNSGLRYYFDLDIYDLNDEKQKTISKKDAIENLKKDLQPYFSYGHYHKLNEKVESNSLDMYPLEYQKFLHFNYNLIPISFDKWKNVNPFLQFYNKKIQEEKQYQYLEKEFSKI